MEAAPNSALALAALEAKIGTRVAEYGQALYRANLQPLADALPRLGSDGKPLLGGRIVAQRILTPYGPVELQLFSGRCQTTNRFEMPFKTRYCRGERHPVSPLLERKIVTTACETGSFEKASKVCAEWGCEISDDKVMTTLRNVGAVCTDSDLPELCEDAATSEDVLIVMMDGWMARFRGEDWGDADAASDSRVAWHESKSAVIFRLSQEVDVSNNRRMIIRKHIVIEPAETSPEVFARNVESAAKRMGMLRAAKVYFIMDGGTYLWNIHDLNFSAYGTATLDYYHASQHLGVLADALFATAKDPSEKDAWLAQHRRELKSLGPANLIKTLSEIDFNTIRRREAKRIARREVAYFKGHEEHMHYEKNAARGVPIGSGAMESQCAQNQNRFKRRGQFWSQKGFELAIKAYVRYANNELRYCYARRAA